MRDFVHLHLHSQYSILDGAIRLGDMMPRLNEFGMKHVAVTDHGNMFGAIDFYKKAHKHGVKPILGVEAYVSEGDRREKTRSAFHLILLARTNAGYANLRKLVSFAYLEGHYYHPRMDLDLIREHNEGLIALSACLGGQIAQAILKGRDDHALHLARKYRDTFEPGAFYLEVQPNGLEEQKRVNATYRHIGKELGIPLVATNDCHYLDRKDHKAHEILMCVQMGKTLDDPNRLKHDTDAYWLRPADEMWRLLGDDFADALENTVRIAESCDVKLTLGEVYLPKYQVPEDQTIDQFLLNKAQEGLIERFSEFDLVGKEIDKKLYQRRLDDELGVISSMGFAGYFLIVQDFINWAKDQDIAVGPGRGSGAGSLAAYSLRITDIDPLPYGLLFERFLNPERVSMPDFDVDFCMNRRDEVIQYVTRKYGKDQVGQIATFGSLKARGVIKDVGRVLGMSYGETDRLTKMVPEVVNITLQEAIDQEPRLKQIYETEPKIRELLDIAKSLEGLHRNVGMHAAGVVIGDKPLWEYCPVFKGVNDDLVTQFAKDEVELAGLVKFDFLGLKTLTVIQDAVRMINRERDGKALLDLERVGLDAPAVYEIISRGDTEGIFQLESSGFQELLRKLRPDKFEDIIAAVALYRPGPLNSGMLDDFIDRKHGRQKIAYPHELLRGILQETYGVIVYQEQVMQIAQVLAGFTLGGADLLRRAMGKKKADEMAKQRTEFLTGAARNHVPAAQAGDIFDLMEKFAEYGFNKSHSAAYALITYHTAYLKALHPVEFMAAVLSNDKDTSDKVSKGIRTAKKMGIDVLAPSINASVAEFDSVGGKILFGMAGVKGVGTMAVEAIVEARKKGGAFADLFGLCERVDMKRVNKKVLEALVKAGALDFSGEPRARLIAALDLAVERAQQAQRDREVGQESLFGMLMGAPTSGGPPAGMSPELQKVEEWSHRQLLAFEKECLGFYVSGHPLDRYIDQIERYATATLEELRDRENHARVTIAGIVTSLKIRPFKNGDGRMGIMTFEDHTGSLEMVAIGDEFTLYEALLSSDEPLLITGQLRVERVEERTEVSLRVGAGRSRRGEPELTTPSVVLLADVRSDRATSIEISVDATKVTSERLLALRQVLSDLRYAGQCHAFLKMLTDDRCEVVMTIPDVKLSPGDDVQDALRRAFGGDCTVHIH
ncbi:MAG: DNA polymerase III subunit alpha [Myxococcales bacterium]|nr:DNA polymerase III subunit alpha [Myxococcales bacterium]